MRRVRACAMAWGYSPNAVSLDFVEATYLAPVARLLLAWLAVVCVGTVSSSTARHRRDMVGPPDGARVAARLAPLPACLLTVRAAGRVSLSASTPRCRRDVVPRATPSRTGGRQVLNRLNRSEITGFFA